MDGMFAGHLYNVLKPFRHITKGEGDNAVSLTDSKIIGWSQWAYIIANIKTGLPENADIVVDGNALLAVLQWLPETKPISFRITEGSLCWACSEARGRIALLERERPARRSPATRCQSVPAGAAFVRGFDLGSIACMSGAKGAAVQLNRTVIYADGAYTDFLSTDNMSLSHYTTESPLNGRWVVSEIGCDLLKEMVQPNGVLDFSDTTITYYDDNTILDVNTIPVDPKHNLKTIAQNFTESDLTAELNKKTIAAFIRRANNLLEHAEGKQVTLGAEGRKIIMEFTGNNNDSSEYYLSESLPDMGPNFSVSVRAPADKIARALEHCDKLSLNHTDRRVLLFLGDHFRYLVMGPAPKPAATKQD